MSKSKEKKNELPRIYRHFATFEEYMHKRYVQYQEDKFIVSKILRGVENILYFPSRIFVSFPNGNAMPGRLQAKTLESQRRNQMTYALWGIISDGAFQILKLYVAWLAASTNTVAGFIAAGGFGLWTAYRVFSICLRGFILITIKKPIAFILIEAADIGYLYTKNVWRHLYPVGRVKDTIKGAESILNYYKKPKTK